MPQSRQRPFVKNSVILRILGFAWPKRSELGGDFVVMLGGVKTKDVLSLTGARIDCAQVFAPLHFPDGSYDSIFFNCVISNLFSVCFRRGFVCGGSRALAYCGFVFRHANSTTPIYRGRFFLGAANCCTRRDECPAISIHRLRRLRLVHGNPLVGLRRIGMKEMTTIPPQLLTVDCCVQRKTDGTTVQVYALFLDCRQHLRQFDIGQD